MVTDTYHRKHWDVAYGASGTVGAVAEILAEAGFGQGIVTREGLAWLRHGLIKSKTVDRLNLAGLKEERKAVIGGGLSVLLAVFDILKIDTLIVAKGALRHGLLYDMLAGNDVAEDLREQSIRGLMQRFAINLQQANNVAKTTLHFFDAVSESIHLPGLGVYDVEKARQILGLAAQCHEIGCAISHSDSQRHGAYILDNTELMGFAQSELHRLSLLVLGHYGKIHKLEADLDDELFICQLIALRLAVIFCHSRQVPNLKSVSFAREGTMFVLTLHSAWQNAYPQTCYLLEEEVLSWQKTNWNLVINTSD